MHIYVYVVLTTSNVCILVSIVFKLWILFIFIAWLIYKQIAIQVVKDVHDLV